METEHGVARLEREEHRADIIIDRPDRRNAMNQAVIEDLTEAFEAVDSMDEVRAVTFLGEGSVFCAGMDLRMMRDRVDTDGELDRTAFPKLLDAIESCSVPTVVGIKKAAPAGAFELTLPCDFRIIGSDAKYGVIEVTLGTFPHGGATQRLPRLIGLAKAKELVLTGEFVDPEEAKRCGLVTDVVDSDRVDAETRAFADDLTSNAPLGMANAKRALNAALETPLDEGLLLERSLGRELDHTRDYREGFEARIEGRDAEFEGR